MNDYGDILFLHHGVSNEFLAFIPTKHLVSILSSSDTLDQIIQYPKDVSNIKWNQYRKSHGFNVISFREAMARLNIVLGNMGLPKYYE